MTGARNKYDYLLILLLVLMAGGTWGAFFQPVRVMMLLLLPVMLVEQIRNNTIVGLKKYNLERCFFLVWFVYALISLHQAVIMEKSVKYLIHLTIYFFGFIEFLWLSSKAENPKRSILIGWILMFVVTFPVAMYELIFDQHLSLSVQESDMSMRFGRNLMDDRLFASVTFGNLNSYNTVVCLAMAMILIFSLSDNRKDRIAAYVLLAMDTFIIIKNSSRGAFICLIFIIIVYLLTLLIHKRGTLFISTILIAILALAAIKLPDMYSMIQQRFQYEGFNDEGRIELIINGIKELWNSHLLGIGAGNFDPVMEQKYGMWISAPHNLWLEVLTQFGIIIFIGFMSMFGRIIHMAHKGDNDCKMACIIGLLALIPISIIDSTYILKCTTWFYIASLYVLCDTDYNYISEQ